MNQAKLWCVVPAAGIGSRFGGQTPKQYCDLLGKPVIQVTLESLLKVNFEAIVVALHQTDSFAESLACLKQSRIETVVGGQQRADSVLAGLKALDNRVDDQDWVLVHDVARPCILSSDIELLIHQVIDLPDVAGGILASPVSDTLKEAESGVISSTVDRDKLWCALTPQMFRYASLKSALESGIEQNLAITDEASAIEAAGLKAAIVKGRSDNIKITQAEDLSIASAIIHYQQSQGER